MTAVGVIIVALGILLIVNAIKGGDLKTTLENLVKTGKR